VWLLVGVLFRRCLSVVGCAAAAACSPGVRRWLCCRRAGVAVASGVVSIGQAVETSSNVTFAKVTTSLIEGGSTITIDPAGLGDNTGTVVIAGDLTVNGTTTTVNSNEVNIGDAVILLNSDEAGTPSADSGFEVERGTATNVAFKWIEADDSWDMQSFPLQNVILDGGTY